MIFIIIAYYYHYKSIWKEKYEQSVPVTDEMRMTYSNNVRTVGKNATINPFIKKDNFKMLENTQWDSHKE